VILLGILAFYLAGWTYTGYLFWKYGVEHGSGSWIQPIAPAVLLSFFWPIIVSFAMFKEVE